MPRFHCRIKGADVELSVILDAITQEEAARRIKEGEGKDVTGKELSGIDTFRLADILSMEDAIIECTEY